MKLNNINSSHHAMHYSPGLTHFIIGNYKCLYLLTLFVHFSHPIPVTEHPLLRLSISHVNLAPIDLNTSPEELHLKLLGAGNPNSSFGFPQPMLKLTAEVINL